MPDTHHDSSTEQHEGHAARQHADAEHQSSDLTSSIEPAYPVSLLDNGGLKGRGNAPVQAEVIQRMQQTYGNRAVQRFLQRSRPNVQRQYPTPTSTTGTSTPSTGTSGGISY